MKTVNLMPRSATTMVKDSPWYLSMQESERFVKASMNRLVSLSQPVKRASSAKLQEWYQFQVPAITVWNKSS